MTAGTDELVDGLRVEADRALVALAAWRPGSPGDVVVMREVVARLEDLLVVARRACAALDRSERGPVRPWPVR